MNPLSRRALNMLSYIEPEAVLKAVLPTEKKILQLPESVFTRNLTGDQRKCSHEKYHAASLAFLFKHLTGRTVQVAMSLPQYLEYDCVLKSEAENGQIEYKPVQLKQVPDYRPNSQMDLQSEIAKWRKYFCPELLVSVWINRDMTLDLRCLDFQRLQIEQLWLWGDTQSSDVRIHGGALSDWCQGVCWEGVLTNGMPHLRKVRFRQHPLLSDLQ